MGIMSASTVIGAILIVAGAITIALSFATDVAFFQPIGPSILALLIGCFLLVIGILRH